MGKRAFHERRKKMAYYNVKIKKYKDGSKVIIGATEPVFNSTPKVYKPKKLTKEEKSRERSKKTC